MKRPLYAYGLKQGDEEHEDWPALSVVAVSEGRGDQWALREKTQVSSLFVISMDWMTETLPTVLNYDKEGGQQLF